MRQVFLQIAKFAVVFLFATCVNSYAAKSADQCADEAGAFPKNMRQEFIAACLLRSMDGKDVLPIYRCGGEYTNTVTKDQAKNCKLVTGHITPNATLWEFIAASVSADVYLERKPLIKDGAYLKGWSLWSQKSSKAFQGQNFRSSKELIFFKCASRTYGSKNIVLYADTAGEGDTVRSISVDTDQIAFDDPLPESVGESLVTRVCGKR